MQMTVLRAGAGFILELLNYLISKITCALFMNTAHVGNGSGFFIYFFFFWHFALLHFTDNTHFCPGVDTEKKKKLGRINNNNELVSKTFTL